MKRPTLHEDFGRALQIDRSSDRSFGLVFAAFFFLVGLWPAIRGASTRPWALALAVVFGGLALVHPSVLAPLNRGWSRLGLLLMQIVSPIVLGLLFFLTVTPIGLLMRLLGKAPLRLGLDRNTRSYWIERCPPGPAPDTMRRQF